MLLFLLFLQITFAQNIPNYLKNLSPEELEYSMEPIGCNKLHKKFNNISDVSASKRKYDIIHYDLYMDWLDVLNQNTLINKNWKGRASIRIKILEDNINFIDLDSRDQKIEEITINQVKNENFYFNNDTLIIPIENAIKDQEYNLIINYEYIGEGRDGFHIYDSTNGAPQINAYTMNQPLDAQRWMPTNDNPSEKMTSAISVKVPKGFVTASNGKLVDKGSDDISETFIWRNDYPIAPYLMVMNASKFLRWEEKVERFESPSDSISLSYYIFPIDSTNIENDFRNFNAFKTFEFMPSIMRVLNQFYGKYPFDGFGSVVVHPFSYGGMEHQEMQTMNRSWLKGRLSGITHELAHMWIGDMVTCESWDDIWMNEGGASYSEAIWAGKIAGENELNSVLGNYRINYFLSGGLTLPPIWGFNYMQDTLFNDISVPLIYYKGALVYHMLRKNIGDSDYFKILRNYFKNFAYQSINSTQMKDYFIENAKTPYVDLNKFYDQWVYGAGHPVYDLETQEYQKTDGWRYTINLNQIQKELTDNKKVPEVFETQLAFIIKYRDQGENIIYDTLKVLNSEKEESFVYESEIKIDSIYLNHFETLFEVRNSTKVLSVTNNKLSSLEMFPNIIKSSENVNINSNKNKVKSAIIYDLKGQKIQEIYSSNEFNYMNMSFNISLNVGKYYVIFESENGIINLPLIIL